MFFIYVNQRANAYNANFNVGFPCAYVRTKTKVYRLAFPFSVR